MVFCELFDIGKTLFGDFFDLFARPEKPIQWVYVRGNHEVNGIGAEDWFDYLMDISGDIHVEKHGKNFIATNYEYDSAKSI